MVPQYGALKAVIEVRDSPERDIWFLGVMLQGSYQMWRVLGTPAPSPPPEIGLTYDPVKNNNSKEFYLTYDPVKNNNSREFFPAQFPVKNAIKIILPGSIPKIQ